MNTTSNTALHERFRVSEDDVNITIPETLSEAVDNLRHERYPIANSSSALSHNTIRRVYYAVRPLLPVAVRKHMQRSALRGWEFRNSLSWPVDCTVDLMLEKVLIHALQANGNEPIPFIWFWPEGKQSCVLMTHDVETEVGLNACDALMNLNEQYGIPSSFQLIPTGRYQVTKKHLQQIRSRNFEANVHDWNHDGFLFRDEHTFLERAAKINACLIDWNTKGFRSGALYRNSKWIPQLNIEYDMSVPNVARLDPQNGGCCTVFPWFNDHVLEIPVTMVQDYSLFNILKDYSLDIWKRQLQLIQERNGIASFIVHPDYIQSQRARNTYQQLLALLASMRTEQNLWITLPDDVNKWWRDRSQMSLHCENGQWKIIGQGSKRARIAYATLDGNHLKFTLHSSN